MPEDMFHVQKFTEETNHGTIPKSVQYIDTTNGLKNKTNFIIIDVYEF